MKVGWELQCEGGVCATDIRHSDGRTMTEKEAERILNAHDDLVTALREIVEGTYINDGRLVDAAHAALAKAAPS